MRIRGTKVYFGAAVAVLACGLAARADSVTVTATFNSVQLNTVETQLKSNYNDSNNGTVTTTVDTVAGIYNFMLTNISGSESSTPLKLSEVNAALGITATNKVFHAVCIDFTHNVYYGQTGITWQVEDLKSVGATINGVGISPDRPRPSPTCGKRPAKATRPTTPRCRWRFGI